MFTKTITIERHIEELRAELRTVTDARERSEIQVELDSTLLAARHLDRETEARIWGGQRERRLSLSLLRFLSSPGVMTFDEQSGSHEV